jgi:serine/threonine-protein kinase RsbW/stage II sporulation protein AB (anti-sigma F factor)
MARDETFRLRVAARPENVPRVRHAIIAFAREVGIRDVSAVGIAVTEAVTNAVVHAYDTEPGDVTVEARRDDAALVVTVSDDGAGIRPRPDSPGLGLGLPLLHRLTEAAHLRAGPSRGTVIELRFPA